MNNKNTEITIGDHDLTIQQIIDVALGKFTIRLSADPSFKKKIERSRKMLITALENSVPVYGVNTGYGKSCGKRMDKDTALKNSLNIIKFHGCGTGDHVGIPETRAAMLTRVLCFSRGYSGVTPELLRQLVEFINRGITPVVRRFGRCVRRPHAHVVCRAGPHG
jgi:histidine ammonia-lyase